MGLLATQAKANTQQVTTPTPGAIASSPTPTAPTIPGIQQWTTILKGESAHGLTFTWLGDRTFQANIFCGDRADCTKPQFRGDIITLFSNLFRLTPKDSIREGLKRG